MSKTAVIFSPKYYDHNPGRGHPESPKRLSVIIDELRRGALSRSNKWKFVEPEKARREEIELVHDSGYLKLVESVCKSGGGLLDSGDTTISPESFDVALYAAGGVLKAIKLVMKREFVNAFALVRPPGHHAEKFRGMGFCVFNNVAIAAKYLLKNFGLKRVLILDIDAHHGNGTQEAFYESSQVLYLSLHEDPRSFPGTGFIDEIGEGEGLGYTVNIPFPFGTGDQIYLKAVKEIAVPIIRQYKPQFMLVSAGLDGHYSDPVANLSLSISTYQEIYEALLSLAEEECGGRFVSSLEGGYSLKFVGKIAAATIARMSLTEYRINDKSSLVGERVRKQGEKVLRNVKAVQRSFWNID